MQTHKQEEKVESDDSGGVTIENYCAACGKGPCLEPCKEWNDFLEKNYLLPKK